MNVQIRGVQGIAEVEAGDDLVALIGDAIDSVDGLSLVDGDILVVTSKIVSKAEGRLVRADDRAAAIDSETVRVVAKRGDVAIVENRLGIVGAAAGVDASNVPDGFVALLPLDPDASARALVIGLRERFGVTLGVLVSDTLGRPWRVGQTDVAIGAAGVHVLSDLRESTDAQGRRLGVTMPCVADEICGAAELVKPKASGIPLAVVSGLGHLVSELDLPGAASIIRPAAEDMFREGS